MEQIRSVYAALQFLTRLPLPGTVWSSRELGQSAAYFPVAGLLIGALLKLLHSGLSVLFPQQVVAAFLVIAMVVITGGLHLDGLMDSADGLFSGKAPEQIKEIMRDSRVGAFGVIAAASLLLLKFTFLLTMPVENSLSVLLLVPLAARWSLVPAITLFPYARQSGKGTVFNNNTGWVQMCISTAVTVAASYVLGGGLGLAIMLSVTVVMLLFAWRVVGLLGGFTGDVYGALVETNEVIALIIFSAWQQW